LASSTPKEKGRERERERGREGEREGGREEGGEGGREGDIGVTWGPDVSGEEESREGQGKEGGKGGLKSGSPRPKAQGTVGGVMTASGFTLFDQ
jgi:hypothetical protein